MSEASAVPDDGVVTKSSRRSFEETVRSFIALLEERSLHVFAVIDQADAARRSGLDLRETTVVEFGNPATGTPIMAAAPLAALDLPLKVVVWDDDGQTKISYYSPSEIGARHGLAKDLVDRLLAIDALTDALVGG